MPVYSGPGGSADASRPGYSAVAKTEAARVPSQPAEVDQQYTLDSVDPIGRWEGIIVGAPGKGKTVLASTFPKPFRWIAADGKTCLKSVRWAFKEGKTSIKDLANDLKAYTPVEEIPDDSHYAVRANAFNKMTDMIDHWFSPGEVETWVGGTLVMDSASMVNEWAMNLALNVNGQYPTAAKPLSGSHSINERAKLKIITGKQDYKSTIALFQGMIDDVRVLCAKHDRNLVLLCHEWIDDETDDQGNRTITAIKPNLTGQLRDTLPKSFDDVWHMQVYNGKEYKVQVHSDPKREAKTRWGGCLDREEPADFRTLIAKVQDYHNLSAAEFKAKYKAK